MLCVTLTQNCHNANPEDNSAKLGKPALEGQRKKSPTERIIVEEIQILVSREEVQSPGKRHDGTLWILKLFYIITSGVVYILV